MSWKKAGEYRGQALGMSWWNSEDGGTSVQCRPAAHTPTKLLLDRTFSFQRDLGPSFQTDILKTARICNRQSFSGKSSFVLHSPRERGWQLRERSTNTGTSQKGGFLLLFTLSVIASFFLWSLEIAVN